MRDRTLIILALVFLIFIVGAGVNRSLEACSKMVGQPLAPGISNIYIEPEVFFDHCKKKMAELKIKAYDRAGFLLDEAVEAAGIIREKVLDQKKEFLE